MSPLQAQGQVPHPVHAHPEEVHRLGVLPGAPQEKPRPGAGEEEVDEEGEGRPQEGEPSLGQGVGEGQPLVALAQKPRGPKPQGGHREPRHELVGPQGDGEEAQEKPRERPHPEGGEDPG